jgi:hypothetical protein
MKKLAIVIGLMGLCLGAAGSAQADYAVVKFKSGYCRVWDVTKAGPQDGKFLWFRHHDHKFYRFRTAAGAEHATHKAAWRHRCHHWM